MSGKQTWSTFLRNHAQDIWAVDFLQTYDLFFRTLFVFVVIELDSRRLVHFGVTRSPDDAWVAQQLREATPFGEGPRFLIRDNDNKLGDAFARVADGTGIEVLTTPYQAPKANAICERFLGSVRRECLDFGLTLLGFILNGRHLHQTLKQYQAYFNQARPHQGLDQRIPCPPEQPEEQQDRGKIISHPVLGGLHHDYQRRTAAKSLTPPRCPSVWGRIHSCQGCCPTQSHTTKSLFPRRLGRPAAYSRAEIDLPSGEKACQMLSDRPFCCVCAGTEILTSTKPVPGSPFGASPERAIPTEALIVERIGVFGQDSLVLLY